jgi:O-methyltransferase involved in polyketide biosynthesis
MEHRMPIATRWTLYALGAVEGHRVRRPRDPVAAWLLRRHPKLLPTFAAPSILSMIRARSVQVDALIGMELSRLGDDKLTYWSLGGGFDARWYRLKSLLEGRLAAHHEIEASALITFKDRVLKTSSFAGHWGAVQRTPLEEGEWTALGDGGHTLVNLEGVAVRLGVPETKELLARVRKDAPNATVILDLPGILQPPGVRGATATAVGSARSRWMNAAASGAAAITSRELHHLGYTIVDDSWFAARPELRAPSGMSICSGVEALRVLRMRPR